MKTLLILNDIESPLQFLLVDGDYSRFHGVNVNSTIQTGFEEEFCNFVWNVETGILNHIWSEDKSLLENKEWDKIAICTFLP